jgi:pyridoxal phosphate enzyme (YggS family)
VRLHDLQRRIDAAAERAGRDPATVRLIAVSKGVDAARVDEAIAAGATELGENRVQEAQSKRRDVAGVATWHLVGHLQRNKAKRAAELFDVVQSIDGERVAEALAAHRVAAHATALPVLIEVELTGIPARSGARPDAVAALARAIADLDGLRLMGLMTIAPPVSRAGDAAPHFRRVRELRDRLEQQLGRQLPQLSMGMSDDFEVAIAEGATMVRVGRAIFGDRA